MAINIVVAVAGTLASLYSILTSQIAPINRLNQYTFNQIYPNANPTPIESIKLLLSGEITSEEFFRYMRDYGYNSVQADRLLNINKNYHTISDVFALYRKNKVSKEYVKENIGYLGYEDWMFDGFDTLTQVYPSAQDLIVFAVREVFTPEIANKYRLGDDLPQKYLEECKKVGLSDEFAKYYWMAHWQLPSPNQVFEMFHRTSDKKLDEESDLIHLPSGKTIYNVIGNKTVQNYLKAADFMPFWRDKLTEISYNTLTRVDVRRMYGLGVIDEDQVFRNYIDIGYNEENAKLMTEFTIRYEKGDYSSISRTNIVKAFKDNLIDKNEMIELFKNIGLAQIDIEFWTEQAEFEQFQDTIDNLVDSIVIGYKQGAYTQTEVRQRLYELDLPSSYILKTLNKLDAIDTSKMKGLSRVDIDKLYAGGFIEREDYYERMIKLGYSQKDVILLEKLIKGE